MPVDATHTGDHHPHRLPKAEAGIAVSSTRIQQHFGAVALGGSRLCPSSHRPVELGSTPNAVVGWSIVSDDQLIPAATVLLVRDAPEGLQVLMLRRNSKIAFGGMWVFPGGAVEDADRSVDDETSARAAAVRETEEETGLIVEAESLATWSYWEPPQQAAMSGRGPIRRFATYFFVTGAPDGEVAIDMGEIHEHRWLTPSEALELRRSGEIEIVPPTWVTLYQLASHATAAEAVEWARATPTSAFCTRPIAKDPLTLAWEGDVAYGGGPVDADGPRHRLTMLTDDWSYVRSA